MDQEKQIKEEQISEVQQNSLFLLPGQPVPSQFIAPTYNNQMFKPIGELLIPLNAGYPSIKLIKSQEKNVLNLQKFQIQYLPAKNDIVIGKIKIRTAQSYIVDMNAPMDGILGGLEFDGVTKRNKPNLEVGDTVYTRVLEYSKFVGGKLSCINKGVTKKNSNQLGQLKGGFTAFIPSYKHKFLAPYLQKIGKCVKFEIALGKNGLAWINSSRNQNTMIILNIVKFLCSETGEKDDRFQKMLAMIN